MIEQDEANFPYYVVPLKDGYNKHVIPNPDGTRVEQFFDPDGRAINHPIVVKPGDMRFAIHNHSLWDVLQSD